MRAFVRACRYFAVVAVVPRLFLVGFLIIGGVAVGSALAGPVSTAPHVLVVSSKLPVKTLQELVDYAKANPGKVSFASAGTGGTAHLGMEMFKLISGADVLHVPYKGSSGAFNDLASGQVSAMFSSLPSLQGLADKGLVRILASTAPSTSPATKNLPLMGSVLPGLDRKSTRLNSSH